jgi:arylsulfatase A-like enzyme
MSRFLELQGVAAEASSKAAAKRCVLIWLDGGPSHLETFDPKPDAPAEVRGPFGTIETKISGTRFSEHLPNLAERADKLAIVRSTTSPLGEHNLGAHYLLTGYRPSPALAYPLIGSVVTHLGPPSEDLPNHFAIAAGTDAGSYGRLGSGYLPPSTRPFVVKEPARGRSDVLGLATDSSSALTVRLDRRRAFAAAVEQLGRGVEPDPQAKASSALEQAHRLLTSEKARAAFDLATENPEVHAKYGDRPISRGCLLARRLIERDVPFVTVNNAGWDTHDDLDLRLRAGYAGAQVGVGLVPSLDRAVAALIDDLEGRGLLAETLIVVMGEFGRTPKLNTRGGRDHWPQVFSVMFAGGGVKGGQVIGASDRTGETPADRPVTPADLAATIFTLLGIDPKQRLYTPDGRPIEVSRDGQVVAELIS